MNTNIRLQKIADYASKRLLETYQKRTDRSRLDHLLLGGEYRWQHTLRVAQYGKVIAEAEGADLELVLAACLLHDIAWFETTPETTREHGRLGGQIAQPFLEKLRYTPEQVKTICYSIVAHVDIENPDSLEAKVLRDADNVDRYGPYRVLQWCFQDIDDYPKLAEKLRERIQRLEGYRQDNNLFTQTGRQLFIEQLDLQIAFFSQFVGEKDLSIMPSL